MPVTFPLPSVTARAPILFATISFSISITFISSLTFQSMVL